MNRKILEKPFSKNLIKKRKGRGGKQWEYIKAGNIIERLNEGFEGEWSFDVMESQREGDEIIVLGKLSHDGISKMQYGGKKIEVYKSGPMEGEVISIGDDFKSAASDSLKKCATMFGVALELYVDVSENDPIEANEPSEGTKTQPGGKKGTERPTEGTQSNESTGGKRQPEGPEWFVRSKLGPEIGVKDVKVYLGKDTAGGLTAKEWQGLVTAFNKYKEGAEWFAGKITKEYSEVIEFSQHYPGGWSALYPEIKAIKDGGSIDGLWAEFTNWQKGQATDEDAADLAGIRGNYKALIDRRKGWETPAKRVAEEAKMSDKPYAEWGMDQFLNAITALEAVDKLAKGE